MNIDKNRLAPFRAALRLAYRTALAAKGRSLLIITMVAIPVAGLAGVAVVGVSMLPTAEEKVAVELGQTDARLQVVSAPDSSLVQSPSVPERYQVERDSSGVPVNSAPGQPLSNPVDLLPQGTNVIAVRSTDVTVETATGIAGMLAFEGKVWSQKFEPKFTRVSGEAPSGLGQIMATASALDRLGVEVGDTVKLLDPTREVRVVGVLDAAQYPDSTPLVFGELGAFTGERVARAGQDDFYVIGHPLDWLAVQQLNRSGVVVLSRSVLLDPPLPGSYELQETGELQGPAAMVVAFTAAGAGFAAFQVALLAGAAFAVGARRQQGAMAVVASVGGQPHTLFQIVTAGGLVLGLVGGLGGVVVGTIAGSIFMEATSDGSGVQYWGYHVPIPLLMGIAGFAVLIGWFAAVLPAWAASRMDVLAALRGSRRPAAERGRRRWLGIALTVVGLCLTAAGVVMSAGNVSAEGLIAEPSLYQLSIILVVVGPLLSQIGVLVLAPALLALLGGGLARLGLGPRLASRDVVRNGPRSVPVLGAIMTTVFLATLLLALFGGFDKSAEKQYERWTAEGQLMVELLASDAEGQTALLPIGAQVSRLIRAQTEADEVRVLSAVPRQEDHALGGSAPVASIALRPDLQCEPPSNGPIFGARCGVSTYTLVDGLGPHIWTGSISDLELILDSEVSSEAERVLEDGGAVSLYPEYLRDDGTIEVNWWSASAVADGSIDAGDSPERTASVNAALQQPEHPVYFGVFLLDTTAKSLGLQPVEYRVLASFTAAPDEAAQDQLRASFRTLTGGVEPVTRLERGPGEIGVAGWALITLAALVSFGAAGVALGLARVDARRDDATLSSVGADGRIRRQIVFWQALLLTGTATIVGGGLGLIAPALLGLTELVPFAPPWWQVGFLVLGLPFLLAAAGGVFTPSTRFDERQRRGV